jgi:hypothetical protein
VKADRRAPFTAIYRDRHRGRSHAHRLAAKVRLVDGRRAKLRRRLLICAHG